MCELVKRMQEEEREREREREGETKNFFLCGGY